MSTSNINITQERERVELGTAPIHHPSFIPDPTVAVTNPSFWRNTVLGQVALLTFVLNCLPDVDFFRRLLACDELPNLWKAITSVSFPQFYQFAGIRDNRTSNPYLDICKGLNHLEHLALTFHTGGLTTSLWHERERMAFENQAQVERSKELRVLRRDEVVRHYKLEDVFELKKLAVLDLECVDSELVAHFVKVGDALTPFRELEVFFKDGFARRGQRVRVNMTRTPVAYTG